MLNLLLFIGWSYLLYRFGRRIELEQWLYVPDHRMQYKYRLHCPQIWPGNEK
jgi:hypothetical protein